MPPDRPILALDLGGTKLAAAVVHGAVVEDRHELPTPAAEGPEAVVAAATSLLTPLLGAGDGRLAVAATGRVHDDGRVSAVNETTMPGWQAFPLAQRLQQTTGREVTLVNDAHAATWGEYRHGAGTGLRDFAFVTVSTGLGGGFVTGGRLARGAHGLAGHLGFWRETEPAARDVPYLERRASGRALGEQATRRLGRPLDARGVLAAMDAGDEAAADLVAATVHRIAMALLDLQLLADPARIAIGGGLGLAPGFLERLRDAVKAGDATGVPKLVPMLVPALVPARLGHDAGLIGAADLAARAGDG